MIYNTSSPKETEAVGFGLAKSLYERGVRRAFIAFRGEMGVGKTAFTRGYAAYYGVSGVKSPTYTIVNEYRGKCPIFHFDMYRIQSEDDLYSIGFDDYVERDGFCLAEWSENVEEFLPEDTIFISIKKTDDSDKRIIEIEEKI